MPIDKEKEILERIERKILNSSVLNGGFERLVTSVEQIQKEQEASKEKLDNIFVLLHEPKEGVFSRLQSIEAKLDKKEAIQEIQTETEKKELVKLEESIKEARQLVDETRLKAVSADKFANQVKKIAGDDLSSLKTVISASNRVTKIFWSLISLFALGAAKLIWEFYKTRN